MSGAVRGVAAARDGSGRRGVTITAEYHRDWRARHLARAREVAANYRRRNLPKARARQKLHRAVVRGDVVRGPCEACGAVDVEAHHDDYDKPLAVRWFCKRHHEGVDRATHCKNGHPYDEVNAVVTKEGFRRCLVCRRAYERQKRY